jgi:hypothetical protein
LQRGALHKFFSVSGNANVNEDQGDEQVLPDDHEPRHDHNLNAEVEVNEDNIIEENLHPSFDNENPNGDDQEDFSIFDPRTWKNLGNIKRDLLIEKRPVRELNLEFPKDTISRHFSYAYYSRKLTNDDVADRKWLVYCKHVNKIYCFCYKFFKSDHSKYLLAFDGLRDWKCLGQGLKEHESSVEHMRNMNTRNKLRLRLDKNKIIVMICSRKL